MEIQKPSQAENKPKGHNQSNPGLKFDPEHLSVDLERTASLNCPNLIGEESTATLIAFKNPTSFIIGTAKKGMIVIEDSDEKYSARLPRDRRGTLRDIVYIDHLDCYLLNFKDKIYRKDIDSKPPYIFLDIVSGILNSRSFRYSKLSRRLVIVKNTKNIAVVNLQRKQVELEVTRGQLGTIFDFKLFGPKQNRIIFINNKRRVQVCSVCYDLKKVCSRDSYQIEAFEGRYEQGYTLAVCDQDKYVLLSSLNTLAGKTSRIMVFQVNQLTKLATIDQQNHDLNYISALYLLGSVGKHVLWVGLSKRDAVLYDFGTESEHLREIEEKRVAHEEKAPQSIHCFGDRLFYTGGGGSIMAMKLRI